ncbi:Rha family transcriptional regulator [Bartonella bovis]|uniref:Rha family transcriptional regulator n=1 Tax=Bartonella bovis TaxID=155194 RepID=UPI00313BBD41
MAQTMSSREIAELCDKEHRNVMRDIRQIFTELKIELSDFAGSYKDSTGRILPCYHLPKRECLILVSGYSTTLRAKIIDRWQELEKQERNSQLDLANALQNPLTIRQLLLPIDKITEAFIYTNQVPNKRLHFTADRLPTQSFLCTLKTLTHCMRVAYSDFVGCGYAIQYPLWGKHNDGL